MAKELKKNGRTFSDFCFLLSGKSFFSINGEQIYKWELFHKGINPRKLITEKSKRYILKDREE